MASDRRCSAPSFDLPLKRFSDSRKARRCSGQEVLGLANVRLANLEAARVQLVVARVPMFLAWSPYFLS